VPKELKIKLSERTPDGVHVFKVAGTLGVEGSAGIQGLLDACMKEKVYRVVLDLEDVDLISSAGMGAFLSAVGELRKKNGDIIFVKMQNRIVTVFKNLDVLDYFIVADDVTQAIERFRGGELPRPPTIEELTAGLAAKAEARETTPARALFSLLAAYADILGADAGIERKLSQIVDVTANYLALSQCLFVPLDDGLALEPAAARGAVPVLNATDRSVLADALPAEKVSAAESLPVLKKELAAWAAKSDARFLLPLTTAGKPVAVLVAGGKKDGSPFTNEERRLLRYLQTSLELALECYLLTERVAGEPPAAGKKIGRKLMEMETIFAVSRGLAEALETEKMLPSFLMMATGQFSTDRAVILLYAADGEFEVRAARGIDDDAVPKLALPPKGLAELIAAQTGPASVDALAQTIEGRDRRQIQPFLDEGIAALAPMRFKNSLIGIVGLGAKISGRDFEADELRLLGALVDLAAVSIETARLLEKTRKNYAGLVRALISAIEAKDKFTRGHTERVTRYAAVLADEVGLDEDQRQNLLFGAVLHDVGYLGVPEEILRMPDGITEEQLAELRRHPLIGVKILKDIPFLKKATDAVRHHHENYDGSGYPDGLAGDHIPLIARIVAVVDAFDAITTDRRYRKASSKEEAVEEIKKNRGKQFDPAIADALIKLVENGRLDVIKAKRPVREV
jgi:anti-anti-sigma factor